MLALYNRIVSPDDGQSDSPEFGDPEVLSAVEPTNVSSLALTTSMGRKEVALAQGVELMRDMRTGRVNINPQFRDNEQLQRISTVMVDHAHRLVEWDVRFDHINELFRFTRVFDSVVAGGDRPFFETSLKQIDGRLADLQPKRSFVLGGSLGVMSSVVIWIFRNFNGDIISALERVVDPNLR